MNKNILAMNGLSLKMLESLSYESDLGISLKKDLRYFEKTSLIEELSQMMEWYDNQNINVALDYRIKSIESALNKYERYYPDAQTRKAFNDILGFRAFCDSYEQIFALNKDHFRIADMSRGKAKDDGYRGVHVYYQKNGHCYPIEIQFNTLYDRQLNNWLHDYLYKKAYSDEIGASMRKLYEIGRIHNVEDFKEELKHVLSSSEG